jgi:hypothetical protein
LDPIAVQVICYDVLKAVATGHEVVYCIRVLESQPSWHTLNGNTSVAGGQEETWN